MNQSPNKSATTSFFTTKNVMVFVIGILLSFSTAFAQTDSLNKLDEKGLKQGKWEKIDAGKIVYQGQFMHGKPIGKFTYYFDDGKTVKSVSDFSKNGVAHVITYHFNGKISSQGKFIDKIKDSAWVYFGDNGMKIADESYVVGKKNGIWHQYDYQTGKLLEEVGYKNDLQHGLMQAWTPNEKLRYKINYKEGKANGPYFAYFSNGSLSESGLYRNSLKDSVTTYFDQTGKIVRKRKYNKGQIDWDRFWIWNSMAGKKEVDVDSISYIFKDAHTFTVTTVKGLRIKGDGDWTLLADFLHEKGFIYYSTNVIGSLKAPKRLEELEEGVYKVIFKQDLGFDVIMSEADLAFLKAIRPKLFRKK